MLVGRHTTAQSGEIQSFGVHLSVGKERARIPLRNAPENFFPRYGAAHSRPQEPTPGSAVEFWGESVRRNQPLVPQSNIAGSWTWGGGPFMMQRQCTASLFMHDKTDSWDEYHAREGIHTSLKDVQLAVCQGMIPGWRTWLHIWK